MPQVSIISDEAFRLDASTAVCIIVKALHLLIHPADTLARAYLEKVLPEGLPEAYTAHTDELLMLPLYELVERLFVVFNLNRFDEQTAYVCTFYDYLSDYINDNTPDIDGFLRQWEESIGAKTIQSDVADGIRLISIHKSKGLEFDHVIIPFCDWQLEKQSGNILWCQPAEPPFSDLPIVPIDYSRKGMTGTIYENDYHEEHLQNVVDNLNLLYVAFTRARNSLFVLGRRGTSSSRSAIIEQTLPLLNNDILPGAVVSGTDTPDADMTFDYGTLDAWKAPDEKATDEANVFLKKAMPLPVTISSFDNKVEFRQSNSSRQFVGGTDDTDEANDYIQIGSVLHTIFSTIHTTADIGPALARLEMEGVLDSPTITSRITTLLRRRLEHPKVADWFSPRWTLFNECTILEMKDSVVTEHRPDRIMTDGQEWIVVDFKFGNPDNDHHKQVRRYMHLLRQMGHQHISGYLWYVYTNRIENVKETESNENIS
jgi:ATP-dependent exoDNAse (exonuclease V) beta subunit